MTQKIETSESVFNKAYVAIGAQNAKTGEQTTWLAYAKKFVKPTLAFIMAGLGAASLQQTQWAPALAGLLLVLDKYAQEQKWY